MKKFTTLAAVFSLGILGLASAEESTYPLTTCVISGEALDAMGKPFATSYDGEEVLLCCKMCQKEFDETPAAYVAKVRAAKAAHAAEAVPPVDQ